MMWHTRSGAVTALTITARQFQVLAPAFAAMSGLVFVIFLWTRLWEYPSSVAISRTVRPCARSEAILAASAMRRGRPSRFPAL